jgi:transposase
MARRRIELPNTVAECHKLILELYAKLEELEDLVAQLRRELYGSRRERFIVDESASDDWDRLPPSSETPATPAPAGSSRLTPGFPAADPNSPVAPASATDKQLRTSSGRRPRVYDPTTPREKVYHRLNEQDVPPEILNHPRARRFFRYVREEVELPQRRLRIIEHYQEVIVVDDALTMDSPMSVASVPEPLLDRCYVGPSLLAYLTVSRFADHIPYYREEDILRRSGLSIHRSTQWRWMHGLSQFVLPLVTLMRERLLCARVLGIDETPCPLLDPDLTHTRKAYLYAQYGDDTQPYVGYYFASHKTRDHIQAMLQGFQGVLHLLRVDRRSVVRSNQARCVLGARSSQI